MFTHTYPHKPLRKIKVTICNHQADNPLYVWPDVWASDLQALKKYIHTWHWKSLLRPGVIKQHKSCMHRNQKLAMLYLLTNLFHYSSEYVQDYTGLLILQLFRRVRKYPYGRDLEINAEELTFDFCDELTETFFLNKCSKLAEHFTNCVIAMTFKTYLFQCTVDKLYHDVSFTEFIKLYSLFFIYTLSAYMLSCEKNV